MVVAGCGWVNVVCAVAAARGVGVAYGCVVAASFDGVKPYTSQRELHSRRTKQVVASGRPVWVPSASGVELDDLPGETPEPQ